MSIKSANLAKFFEKKIQCQLFFSNFKKKILWKWHFGKIFLLKYFKYFFQLQKKNRKKLNFKYLFFPNSNKKVWKFSKEIKFQMFFNLKKNRNPLKIGISHSFSTNLAKMFLLKNSIRQHFFHWKWNLAKFIL